MALAMDARGFGRGPRSTYRPIRWTPIDGIAAVTALVVAVGVLVAFR
jgi:energy-coupling factor transporter transmembrane protein EcfT